jgi:hypothetical protein
VENLFRPDDRAAIVRRLEALRPDAPRQWGKMDAAQMLAHLSVGFAQATGDRPQKQIFIGKILAPFIKGWFLGPKPFSRNSPTGPDFIIQDARDFATERRLLLGLVSKFCDGGPERANPWPHGFIGRMRGDEWGRVQWKHLDHHLRQFGA